jgi:hypothetical protein
VTPDLSRLHAAYVNDKVTDDALRENWRGFARIAHRAAGESGRYFGRVMLLMANQKWRYIPWNMAPSRCQAMLRFILCSALIFIVFRAR